MPTCSARPCASPSELTLFKSLGIALEDVAFAELVYQRALAAKLGRPIPI
jgi:ornithine cyclodeaminase/alanine dehydrogenase-like protein (mu-crystallin family)